MARLLVVRVGDLLREPGSRRDVERVVPVDDLVGEGNRLATSSAAVIPGTDITVEGLVMGMAGGIEATGRVGLDWFGDCRRCLDDVTGHLDIDYREICQREPVDDDVLPIEGDLLDLEPLVRELILATLPLAPLCAEDCAGPAPERFPTTTETEVEAEAAAKAAAPDPRWAALADLEFD